MKSLTNIPTRLAASAATAASVTATVAGVIALTHTQSGQTTIVGTIEHIHIGMFAAVQLCLVPVTLYFAGRAGVPKLGIASAVAGVVLAALATQSNISGEDAAYFAAVAAPTNLTIFATFVVIARKLYKKGELSRALAIGMPLVYFVFLPGQDIGGPFLFAGYWMTVGWMLMNDALTPRRSLAPAVSPATA